jgi:hypothetical protein
MHKAPSIVLVIDGHHTRSAVSPPKPVPVFTYLHYDWRNVSCTPNCLP